MKTKACDMPNCCDPETGAPRRVAATVTICNACRSWHSYHMRRKPQEFARYCGRVQQAAGRVENAKNVKLYRPARKMKAAS